jgi:hypothetical protein
MKTTARSPQRWNGQYLFGLLVFLSLNVRTANAQRTMAVDRFGNSYTEEQVYINGGSNMQMGGGGPVVCTTPNGLFALHFNESGAGFDDMVLGAQRRDVACQVFADLEQLILPAANPYPSPYPYPGVGPTPTVHIDVQDFANITDLPANAIAAASSYYSYLPVPYPSYISCPDLTPPDLQEGVLDGEVWKTINGGVDSWRALPAAFLPGGSGPGIYHGFFGVKFSAGAPAWYTGSTLPAPPLEVDLYKVIAHEAMHLLGFNSLTTDAGTGFMGTNYYSRLDLLLQQNGSSWINDPVLCADWATNTNATFNSTSGLCDVTLSGIYSGVNPPIVYTPSTWDGSNLSHLDATCPGGLTYLMNPAIYPAQPRIPLQEEVNVLCDIDYHTNTHHGVSGSAWDGTFETRTSCGRRLAGVDDLFSDYVTFDFYKYKQGQPSPITVNNFLSNDEDETQTEGMPVDHDCLEVIIGGNATSITNESATSFDYTPPAGYVGWAVVRYRPIASDGRRGNWTHIFIEVWPPDICGVETCNIVNGGGFEGIDPNSYSVAPHNSFNFGGSMTPDLKMWNNGTSQWENQQSCTTGEIECGNGVSVAPSWNWAGPPGNERYVGLYGATITDYSVEGGSKNLLTT